MSEIADIEHASREIRLAQQHIFRESLNKQKLSYRKIIFWVCFGAAGLFVLWFLYHCQNLHPSASIGSTALKLSIDNSNLVEAL